MIEEELKQKGFIVKGFKEDGKTILVTFLGTEEELTKQIAENLHPIFMETMPLSLEEVFLDEMEGTEYDFSKIFSK